MVARIGGEVATIGGLDEYMYQWPEHICVDTALDAELRGTSIRTYTQFERLERASEHWQLYLSEQALEQNGEVTINARAVVNAAGPWVDSVGETVALNSMAQFQKVENIDAQIGIWECEPGKLKRYMPQREFSYILSGWCIFTPEGGEPVELHAGDSVTFPANCQGVWEIKETLRKVFCLF